MNAKDLAAANARANQDNEIKRLKAKLHKWEHWQPDDTALAAAQAQAQARDGSYESSLAAQTVYIHHLEAYLRRLETRQNVLEEDNLILRERLARLTPLVQAAVQRARRSLKSYLEVAGPDFSSTRKQQALVDELLELCRFCDIPILEEAV